jgi:putative hydrolase of the HAD superfamily
MGASAAHRLDWAGIDTVLLDMDGTLLDLGFDNFFWREYVPQRFGASRGLATNEALAQLEALYQARQGTLEWYCLDFWSRELDLDVKELKRQVRDRIRILPRVPQFLERLRRMDKRLVLVTNAHQDSLLVKMEQTALHVHFDAVYCSHDFGLPKEDPVFWGRLQRAEPFDPGRSLLADDSVAVLAAARDFGIAHLVAMLHPDLCQPPREACEFPGVPGLPDLELEGD